MEKHSQTKGLVILLAAKTAMKEPKRSSALVRRETFASYCFLLPSLIFFLGFVIYPMILCVVTSFFDSTMNRADIFVGMANYKTLFADPIFLGALKNTFVIVIVSVPITCIFSLWVSSAIVDLPEWATSLFRCVFYLPVVTGSVAVTVVWKWMYNNYYGIFNYLGKSLGILDKNINWLGDERFALGCIILILMNIFLVPQYGYIACAWAGFTGYGVAMLLSYFVGQKKYPIQYDLKAIGMYVLLAAVLYVAAEYVSIDNIYLRMAYRTVLLLLFIAYVVKRDLPLNQIPILNKLLKH